MKLEHEDFFQERQRHEAHPVRKWFNMFYDVLLPKDDVRKKHDLQWNHA